MPGTFSKNGAASVINFGIVHPPKKHKAAIEDIISIAVYSPRKNSANLNPLYSVKYPATSSLSASGRSKGSLFVSANAATINTKKPKN